MSIPDSKLNSLDELDFAILSHLREDGRKSFTELVNMLDVSVSTIRNRYARLVEDNVLQVYGRVKPRAGCGYSVCPNLYCGASA